MIDTAASSRKYQGKSENRVRSIVDACKKIMDEGGDPFSVDIRDALDVLGELLPKWTRIPQLLLDAEAIEALSATLNLQAERLAQEATSLQIDPTIIAEKVKNAQTEAIAAAFVASWRRIADIRYLGEQKLNDAIAYYLELLPIKQRMIRLGAPPRIAPPKLADDELKRLRIIPEEEFQEAVEEASRQLKKYSDNGIEYYEFIRSKTWEESVLRAFITAYMVTANMAYLEYDPINSILILKPSLGETEEVPRSFAIPLDTRRIAG